MSLLILQSQSPEQSLALDSYGVISTAAMLDQEVTVVYCGEGLKQLHDPGLIEQLQTSLEFGIKAVFACNSDSGTGTETPSTIKSIGPTALTQLIEQSDSVLSF